MASIKAILWKHDPKKDGSLPIAIRITKDRKAKYIFTGEYIQSQHWDVNSNNVRKSHPNSTRLNNFIQKKLSEAHATLLEAEASNDNFSAKQIKRKIKKTNSNVSFFQLGAERVKNKFNAGVFSVANAELSILFNIEEFLNHKDSRTKSLASEAIKERRKKRIVNSYKIDPLIPV